MRFLLLFGIIAAASLLVFVSSHETRAQFIQKKALPSAPEPKRRPWPVANIEIANEPKTIDPATQLPLDLTKPVTVKFDGTPLIDVVAWLRKELKRGVFLKEENLKAEGISLDLPISWELKQAPLYLLLDHLREIDMDWTLVEDQLEIAATSLIRHIDQLRAHYIGDLLDDGHQHDQIVEVLSSLTSGPFEGNGDVVFVQATPRVHREIAGILAALRKLARRTLVFDPGQHEVIRKRLTQPISVNFQNVSLKDGLEEVARLAEFRIRIDTQKLSTDGISETDAKVTLQLNQQPLKAVLHELLDPLGLTWMLWNGEMVITTPFAGRDQRYDLTAVFDVRDLCRDRDESRALSDILQSMIQFPAPWPHVNGLPAKIVFSKPGIMVVSTTGRVLDEVLEFLENYRTALPAGKPRRYLGDDPEEVFTLFYHVPTAMAKDLLVLIPEMIHPGSWKQANRPDAPGTLRIVAYEPRFITPQSTNAPQPATEKEKPHALVDYSILSIRQTRKTHDRIGTLLERMKRGDKHINDPQRQSWEGPVGWFDRD